MPIADRYPRIRRLSPLILLLAAVVIYFGIVAPNTAEDHDVTLAFQGPTHDITRIDVVWIGIDVHPGEAVGGTSLSYRPGAAPSSVATEVHAPNGAYWLEVTLDKGHRRETIRRRVQLGAGDLKVFLPVTAPD